jgi:hypothetical protein
MSSRPSFASLALLFAVLLFAALPAAAQSDPASAAKNRDPAVSAAPLPVPAATDTNAAPAKKVWTNENLNEVRGTVSVVGDKRSQKSLGTPSKPGGSATGAAVRPDLQKLQAQLDDVNKQLALYKAFQDGEPVSTNARDFDKGVSRIPVDQQMVKLKEKAVKLKKQIDDLVDEALKKGTPANQLP